MLASAKKVLAALLAPAVITTVAAVALTGSPAAAAPAAPTFARPAGVWDIQVTRPGASYPGVFTFSGYFTACSGDGAFGLWWPTGRDTFSYKMIGRLNNADGSQFGWIEINQSATLTGGTYAGSGIHHVYDTEWTRLASVEVSITGVRSPADSPC